MAEHHDVKKVLDIARDLVAKLQELIQNKWGEHKLLVTNKQS